MVPDLGAGAIWPRCTACWDAAASPEPGAAEPAARSAELSPWHSDVTYRSNVCIKSAICTYRYVAHYVKLNECFLLHFTCTTVSLALFYLLVLFVLFYLLVVYLLRYIVALLEGPRTQDL